MDIDFKSTVAKSRNAKEIAFIKDKEDKFDKFDYVIIISVKL